MSNLKEIATQLGYLNEVVKTTLKDLTFDKVTNIFSDDYKDIQFTRKQPDGKEGPYYRDAINFPNPDDTSTEIGDMGSFENWKNETMKRFGNVSITLDPEADAYFNKVKVNDKAFRDAEDKFVKGKMAAMQRDQELGISID